MPVELSDPLATPPCRRRRIVMLLDTLQAGGAERVAVELACALNPDRFTPFVLATRHGGPLEDVLDGGGVSYAILGRRRAFSPRAYRQCLRLLRGADLINSHMLGSNLWGSHFARLKSLPLVALVPNLSGSRSRLQTYGYRWWISPAARRIICPTDVLAGLLQNEGVPRELIEVIPNGVRLDAALPRREARVALGLNQKDFVVGIVARLREEKAHEVLFRAVARLRNEGRQISVCVVGDGPQRSRLAETATSLGLDGSITWAGEQAEAKRLPAAFDVAVICSDFEGHPLAALEALAAGIPVISTAVGSMPTILASGAGLTVPVRDDAALATAIRRFMDNRALIARAGAKGRDLVSDRFEFRRMVTAFERVYDEVLGSDTQIDADLPVRSARDKAIPVRGSRP